MLGLVGGRAGRPARAWAGQHWGPGHSAGLGTVQVGDEQGVQGTMSLGEQPALTGESSGGDQTGQSPGWETKHKPWKEVDRTMSQSRGEVGCGVSEYKVRGREVDYEGLRGE